MLIRNKPPRWFWIIAVVLIVWELMGCFAWAMQVAYGPAAMGPVDDWARNYYAALPIWYNWVYAIATIGSLLGGAALLLRDDRASIVFVISLVAVVVIFGYAFAATDLIAHKGLERVLPFPIFIAAVGLFSVWFARLSEKRGWTTR